MTIWFDMDGTIANLYQVESWLDKLQHFDASPYESAPVMHNMSILARYLNKTKQAGYSIGVISWLAGGSTPEYDIEVTKAKLSWLSQHLPSVSWDYINIVPYGVSKNGFKLSKDDILFDDKVEIRNEWDGEAFPPEEIIETLKRVCSAV